MDPCRFFALSQMNFLISVTPFSFWKFLAKSSRCIPDSPNTLSFLTSFSLTGNHCSPWSLAPGKALSQCVDWRRFSTLSSESTNIFILVREANLTPIISMLAVTVSHWSAVRIFSLVCVWSLTSALVSSCTARRSSITAGRPCPVCAARMLDEAKDDCETIDAQLVPGLLVCVLGDVVGAPGRKD